MGKKILGKKMAAIFLPMHFFAPNVFASKNVALTVADARIPQLGFAARRCFFK